MALAQKRRSADSPVKRIFTRMSFPNKDNRRRVTQALEMVGPMLEEKFRDRIELIVVDYESYNPIERTLPLDVQAKFTDEMDAYHLQRAMAIEVFASIIEQTRVIFHASLEHTVELPADGVGIIFPLVH